MEYVRNRLGFEGSFTVEVQGQSRGLALLWRNMNEVRILSYSENHIDVMVMIKDWERYRLTCFYGEPNRVNRQETWDLIRTLHSNDTSPWCVIEDMNNILSRDDMRGGRPYPQWLLRGFQAVVEECDHNDMKLEGYMYMWERGYGTEAWVEIQLDRALVLNRYMQVFTEAKLTNIEVSTSDHCPVFFEPKVIINSSHIKRFKFENAWLREPMCPQIVKEIWSFHQQKSIQEKIALCSEILSSWGK